jgi:hypothetical protein
VIDVSRGDEKDADIAVEAAVKAFKTWKDTTSKERAALLYKMADLVPKYQDEMSYLDAVSMGKPPSPLEAAYVCGPILRSKLPLNGKINQGCAAAAENIRGVTNITEGNFVNVCRSWCY